MVKIGTNGQKDKIIFFNYFLALNNYFDKFKSGHILERTGPRDPDQEKDVQKKKGEKFKRKFNVCELERVLTTQ